jgi:hypothetical protein
MTEIDRIKSEHNESVRIKAETRRRARETEIMKAIAPAWHEIDVRRGRSFYWLEYDFTIIAPGHVPIYAMCTEMTLKEGEVVTGKVGFRVIRGIWPFNEHTTHSTFAEALLAAEK